MITKQLLQELAKHKEQPSISILMPTHRAGMEVKEDKDKIVFKNQLKAVEQSLRNAGYSEQEVNRQLKPLNELLQDNSFWSNLNHGLAIYLAPSRMEVIKLPESMPGFSAVQDTFYITPLIPIVQYNKPFYLLELNMNEVKLFEADRYSIRQMDVPAITPQRLEEAVGYDYQQKSLQYHAHGMRSGEAMYHGQGEGKDEEKKELRKFFETVDDGIMEKINGQQLPLVLACVDYFHPIFSDLSKYPNITEGFVKGSHKNLQPEDIHQKATEILDDYFEPEKEDRLKKFKAQAGTGSTAQSVENIIPEAEIGRVAHLLLQYPETLYGKVDEAKRTIVSEHTVELENKELLNETARVVFNHGGTVDLYPDETFPVEDTYAVAVFRY